MPFLHNDEIKRVDYGGSAVRSRACARPFGYMHRSGLYSILMHEGRPEYISYRIIPKKIWLSTLERSVLRIRKKLCVW